MIPYFKSLGERLEREWRAKSYDEEVFPELALAALEKDPPADNVGVADIVDWIFGPHQAFRQPGGHELFGQPPIQLFQAPRFYIEGLFWLSATTDIHQHAFSGAFAVLAGSSVHSHWRFACERSINSRLLCGRLERVSTAILRPGAVQPIHSGNQLIHQLFHLELPSVTIVVRTLADRHRLPQYNYLQPGLAVDPEDQEPTRTRRTLLLDGMARGQIAGLRQYARRLIEDGDLETLYHAFSVLTRRKVDRDLLEELYSLARERHGDLIDLFRQVCEWERRTRIVVALRSKITDPGARFLLALLMLLPDRDAIFETIELQFPETEPLAAIEGWLAAMASKEILGFDFNATNRLLFRGLVLGLSPEDLLNGLRAELDGDAVDSHRDQLLQNARRLARSDLFLPLLSRSPLQREDRVAAGG
jgi:hypothetical protein